MALIAPYFVTVLGIGFYLRRFTKTGEDFFLAGRGMYGWVKLDPSAIRYEAFSSAAIDMAKDMAENMSRSLWSGIVCAVWSRQSAWPLARCPKRRWRAWSTAVPGHLALYLSRFSGRHSRRGISGSARSHSGMSVMHPQGMVPIWFFIGALLPAYADARGQPGLRSGPSC
jgi:hypothetical protein